MTPARPIVYGFALALVAGRALNGISTSSPPASANAAAGVSSGGSSNGQDTEAIGDVGSTPTPPASCPTPANAGAGVSCRSAANAVGPLSALGATAPLGSADGLGHAEPLHAAAVARTANLDSEASPVWSVVTRCGQNAEPNGCDKPGAGRHQLGDTTSAPIGITADENSASMDSLLLALIAVESGGGDA